jgi:hypothetical protein
MAVPFFKKENASTSGGGNCTSDIRPFRVCVSFQHQWIVTRHLETFRGKQVFLSAVVDALFEPMITLQLTLDKALEDRFRRGSTSHEILLAANELEINVFIEHPETKIVR